MILKVNSKSVFPSKEEFESNYLLNEQPLVITNGCSNWYATKKWSLKYFKSIAKDLKVSVSQYKIKGNQHPSQKVKMLFRELLEGYENYSENSDIYLKNLYLAGWHYLQDFPFLKNDIEIPEIFSDNILPYVNDNVIKYDWSSIFIGHKDTETPNHTDSFYVGVWIALIEGKKTIRYVSSKHHHLMSDKIDLFNNNTITQLKKKGIVIYEAKIQSGDIAFHPSGWWHQVKNHSFNIAVSNNYVNKINFLPFKQQVLSKTILPILNRVMQLDEKFEFSKSYLNSPDTSISKNNISSSNFISNQEKINDFFNSYIYNYEKINKSIKEIND